ncbi:MAG: hypothetical protein M0P31_10360 [Solirubrobacteraceae bacterium]|nr:hypothetical protein [Solirubrobacteraceae bacterium]
MADKPVAPLRIVGAYLDTWHLRRAANGTPRTFTSSTPNAWITLLHAWIAERIKDPTARAVARKQAIAHADVHGNHPPPTLNVVGYALHLDAGWRESQERRSILDHVADAGGSPLQIRSTLAWAWRAAHVAAASADHEISTMLRHRLGRAVNRLDHIEDLSAFARTALPLALIAAGDEHLRMSIGMALRRRLADAPRGPRLHTAHLAQAAVAAHVAGERPIATGLVEEIVRARIDSERLLARARPDGASAFDTSPWVPLAIVATSDDLSALASGLAPRAPALPQMEITDPRLDRGELRANLRTNRTTTELKFSSSDLNLLLRQLFDQIDASSAALSPRLQGHLAIALSDISEATSDQRTKQRAQSLIGSIGDRLVARQAPSGGWAYARSAVPSVIYGAAATKETTFPDREYTIDAAVPGIALHRSFRLLGDQRHLAAARRVFDFLELHVGRVTWNNRPVWRLYPDDDKTDRQGTAVNYEAWVGAYLAEYVHARPPADKCTRARAYIEDVVAYSSSHLSPTGDIAYGDYVRERRTPYASWDAHLLTEIDRLVGLPAARRDAERIVRRLVDLQHPSGIVPNVVDFEDEIDGEHVWLMHRHGIGPYPIRSYYLLYFVVAAADLDLRAALRTLSFLLATMFRPVTGDLSSGYFADGRLDDRPDSLERSGRDWLLLALAALARHSDGTYVPRIDDVEPARTRLSRFLDGLQSSTEPEPADRQLPDRPPPSWADLPQRRAAWALSSWTNGERSRSADEARNLAAALSDDGMWPVRHRPDGDARQGQVGDSLAQMLDAGLDDNTVRNAVVKGAEWAWTSLFDPRTGAATTTPRGRTPMSTHHIAAHVAWFAHCARTAGSPDDRALWSGRSTLAFRHLVMTRFDAAGAPVLLTAVRGSSHTSELRETHNALRRAAGVVASGLPVFES